MGEDEDMVPSSTLPLPMVLALCTGEEVPLLSTAQAGTSSPKSPNRSFMGAVVLLVVPVLYFSGYGYLVMCDFYSILCDDGTRSLRQR